MVSAVRKCLKVSTFFLCSGLYSAAAFAITQEIRATYVPDPANPLKNTFINQTPQSGYCGRYPNDCKRFNLMGVSLPLRFTSVQPVRPGAAERDGAMFKMPAQWRSLTVRNIVTGEAETVEIRIGGFGSRYLLSDTASNLTGVPGDYEAHNALWLRTGWITPPLPCRPAAMASSGPDFFQFFWFTPAEDVCSKQAAYVIPWMTYEYLDVAYEFRTPNPLGMSTGIYAGELVYAVGPGQDIDTGDNLLPDTSSLTFRFLLDVQHVLKIDIPPGGNKVALVPQGGWQAWLQQGSKPARLFRDQTFNISASSRFKMHFECQFAALGACALRDTVSGATDAQVFLSVSLPDSITDLAGQPVKRRPLSNDPSGVAFQPTRFMQRAPATLHFEIPSVYVEQMLQPGKGKRYLGNVTVIWDSEV
ncbi:MULTISPECIES: hypothetical protein [Pseudomonas]|uniref:Uncharacterized protein n=1 Tax=Pseudomonas aphyarum TaxID=2942629 RepID=A0ABT5PJ83_9PSED|nr:hypothetical protein [Pseudomonas aphyarum]MDD0970659.1 hypothetical protein [Pseudomonas aphyarum]MDD1123941.1 hypothetical protein [Pseudomonas aphyarum]